MLKILLVDDETGFLDLAKTYLEKQNEDLEVETISSPAKALKLINENGFDCIVCDYQMPKLDGLEVLKRIRKDLGSDVPFIMFTGKGREEVAMEALNNGADRYIKKRGNPKSQFDVLADAIRQEVEHYRKNKALRKSEERYRRLFETAKDGMLILDARTGEIKDINPYLLNLLGYEKDELMGKKLWELHPLEDVAENKEKFLELKKEGHVRYEDLPLETKDDKEVSVEFDSTTYLAGDEEVVQCNIRDISERVEKEKKLRESRERLMKAIEEAPFPIMLHAEDGEIIKINEVWTEITGYSLKEIPNIDVWAEKAYREKKDRAIEVIKKLFEKKGKTAEGEFEIFTKNGEKRIWDFKSADIGELPDGRKLVISIAMDVTERKRVERNLRLSEERFRKVFENLGDAIFVVAVGGENHGEILKANKAAAEQTGFSRDELVGKDIHRWLFEEPEELTQQEVAEKLKSGKKVSVTLKRKKKDGSAYWAEETIVPFQYEEQKASIMVSRDITERKESEEHEKFLHSLLRHDLQNKSQLVEGYLELLIENPSEAKEYAKKALKACKEGQNIIEKVRTLRDVEKEKISEIKIDSVLEEVIEENRDEANERGIEIEKAYSEKEFKIKAGPLLKVLSNNLVENSIKHSRGTKIKISCNIRDEKIICTIEDNGKGISEDIKNKIFKKRFQHGKTGETGLGLYLVKKIAEKYDGKVETKDSELGGARFDVHLQKS